MGQPRAVVRPERRKAQPGREKQTFPKKSRGPSPYFLFFKIQKTIKTAIVKNTITEIEKIGRYKRYKN